MISLLPNFFLLSIFILTMILSHIQTQTAEECDFRSGDKVALCDRIGSHPTHVRVGRLDA